MLEIIALIFLTKDIGKLAHAKGLKPSTWKIYTVVAWIIFEITGIIVGVIIFGPNNLFSVAVMGIIFAVTSYYIIRAQLTKLPNRDFDDDINNIGRN